MALLADTSVSVPALLLAHASHEPVRRRLDGADVALAAHSALETYSVLTRLPGDARVAPRDAMALIEASFGAPEHLPIEAANTLLADLSAADVAGGAVYDALIGLTARAVGRVLLTRDVRASATYSRLNIAHEFVG
jgi:predicted nucleic acid-binding protein